MKRIAIALSTILIVSLVAALSATAEPISRRLHRQKMRIHQGVDSGALTDDEWRQLMHQHRKIRLMNRSAWRDGYLSYQEQRHLQARLDRASQRIHRLKHNHKWARTHYRSERRDRTHYGDRQCR